MLSEEEVERERENEECNPEDESRVVFRLLCLHVLFVLFTERPTMKTRKFILARLLFRVIVNGAIVPLPWFIYFWK